MTQPASLPPRQIPRLFRSKTTLSIKHRLLCSTVATLPMLGLAGVAQANQCIIEPSGEAYCGGNGGGGGVTYNYAEGQLQSSATFGSAHVGGTASGALSLANTAPANGHSEDLDVAGVSASGAGVSASSQTGLIAAGQSNASAIAVSIGNLAAGYQTGSVTVSLDSDGAGTSGRGLTSLGSQTATVSATGYRYGQGQLGSASLGNVHVGGTVNGALSLANTATADGYSEGLDVTSVSTSGAGVSASNQVGVVLAAGQTNTNAIAVSMTNVAAGRQSGNVTVGLESNGAYTSGLGTTYLGTQNAVVNATGYRYAQGSLTPSANLGNVHVGGSVNGTLAVGNLAPADGYSEGLDVTSVSTSGSGVSASNRSGMIAAGQSNAGAIAVSMANVAAGRQTGGVTVGVQSDGNGTSGLGTTYLGTMNSNISATGYRYAQGSLTPSVNLGNVHVGGSATGSLAVGNLATADGYSEGLDVTSVSSNGAGVSASAQTGTIAAGQSNAAAVAVSMAAVAAGYQTGSVTVGLQSDGAGTSGLGTTSLGTQTASVSATGYRYAMPVVTLGTTNLGNVHVGGTANGAIGISNDAPADGYSEGVDVTNLSASGSGVSASSHTGTIAAGQSNANAISVSMANVAAGLQTGSLAYNLLSDGAGTSGLGTTLIEQAHSSVSAAGYRYATSNLADTTIDFGAARVGDTAPTRIVTIQNTQIADGYSEGLDVKTGAAPSGYTGSLDVSNLAAGGNAARTLSLATGTAGNFSGNTLTLALDSNGAGTSGLGVTALAPVALTLDGKVYQTAQATVTPSLDFGIVHRGDAVAAQAITVANTATGALVDQVTGGLGAVGGPFSGSGSLTGVASGAADSTSLKIGLNTSATGGFNQTAQMALNSHDSDLADVAIAAGPVALAAQVNDYAKPVLQLTGGAGTLTGGGTAYTLDLGDLAGGSSGSANLDLLNALSFADSSAAYTDMLSGSFSILNGAGEFGLTGFDPLSDLGATLDKQLQIAFDTAGLTAGDISEEIEFDPLSVNSDSSTALAPILLTITGNDVPEPASLALLLSGIAGLIGVRRRRV